MDTHRPERRRYPRIKAKVPIELNCPGAPAMRTATDEISVSGCYIETMFTMDVGTKLSLTLSIGGQSIHASGVLMTKYPQVGNVIYFTQMHPDHRRKLSEFISEQEHEGDAASAGT